MGKKKTKRSRCKPTFEFEWRGSPDELEATRDLFTQALAKDLARMVLKRTGYDPDLVYATRSAHVNPRSEEKKHGDVTEGDAKPPKDKAR